MNKKLLFLLFVFFFASGISDLTAESDRYIQKMMSSNVSKFDLYIYKLNESLKCRIDRVSMNKTAQSKSPCMTDIEYDPIANILVMYFYVDGSHKEMRSFKTKSSSRKKKALLEVLHELAIELGVEGQKFGDETIKLGTLQLTPISYSTSTEKESKEEIRFYNEITENTELNLITNVGSKVYKATRTKTGSYLYLVDETER